MLLTYLFDPLCGWCHGAAPVLAALRAADFSLRLSPTGLFSGDGARTLTADALSHRDSPFPKPTKTPSSSPAPAWIPPFPPSP
jgi:putative protein-disulfide isomerase